MQFGTPKTQRHTLGWIVAVGVVLVLLPALGFPARITDKIILLLGAVVIVLALLLRRALLDMPPKDVNARDHANV